MPPICSAQVAMISSSDSGSVTSAAMYSPPTRAAATSRRFGSRATSRTRAPSAASLRAVARPMPLLAPVTTQILSVSPRSIDRAFFRVVRILFVCMGNICRSPTAEGVMRYLLEERGLDGEIELDSAGTGGWHVGAPPDARATEAARARGITLEGAARQVTRADFEDFDVLVAMDRDNLADLRAMAPAGTED